MRITVLGACGAWPGPGQACSGYLVEHNGFRLLLDAALALDRPGLLDEAIALQDLRPGRRFGIGPFDIEARLLPHSVPNAGVRLEVQGKVLSYTGDSGPGPEVVQLAREADLFLAEATFTGHSPSQSLSSATVAADQARRAQARRLVLTHLNPGTDPRVALDEAAATGYDGPIHLAASGLMVEL